VIRGTGRRGYRPAGAALIGAGKGITVVSTQQQTQAGPRCTLCPAGCGLGLAPAGPDQWTPEYSAAAGAGVCPRGSALASLVAHPGRIVSPGRRRGDALEPVDMQSALRAVLAAAEGREVVLLLDGNVPREQIATAAAWADAWPAARLCLVVEPADAQVLAGVDASGADYLSDESLADCDGFVIVGDAFSANPRCSRGVFDRRRAQPRTPIVVIDPAVGAAAKFATHRVDVAPGGELAALKGLSAGSPIEGCGRLGVLIAAEVGRTTRWAEIGYAAGKLAAAKGGGVAVQTTGMNALAAVRLAKALGTISLADALASDGVRVAVGCDVAGMLGRDDVGILAAAAPLPNCTTEAAEIVLPLALPAESGGTFLRAGEPTEVAALMPAPAGVGQPAELVAMLASAAGAARPAPAGVAEMGRLTGEPPAGESGQAPSGTVLLLGRQAVDAGCGTLTGQAAWQAALEPRLELRMNPQDAAGANIENLATVTVRANGRVLTASARLAPELPAGRVVLPEGRPEARALLAGAVEPVAIEVSA